MSFWQKCHIVLGKRIPFGFRDLPLQWKVMGLGLCMAIVLGLGMMWQIHHAYFRLEKAEVQADAGLIANVLAVGITPAVRSGDQAVVTNLLDGVFRAVPSIRRLELLDRQGQVLAGITSSAPVVSGELVFDARAMLLNGLERSLSVSVDDSHIGFELNWHTRRLLITTAITSLLGGILTWWLMRLVTRPILDLVEVTRAAKGGNFATRTRVTGRDEIGELGTAFNDMMGTLQQKEAINQQLIRKLIAAGEEERRRISRELHDQTGQVLTSLIAGLAVLKNSQQTREVTDLLGLATQTLAEVNDLSRALRPSTLDDLGLVPTLQRLAENITRRHGLKVEFSVIGLDGSSRLPPELEVTLYRVAQEALTNAVRHGQAQTVELLLHRKPAVVTLVVEDNGVGFEAEDWQARCLREDHWGLLGIRERAMLLGGSLRVDSRPGGGTSLFIDLPLPERTHG
jgi:signal transduction histidine kinase